MKKRNTDSQIQLGEVHSSQKSAKYSGSIYFAQGHLDVECMEAKS